ncbi:hypothetical protein [Prevotella sp. OH937_COT-195]|uniref:hypothetical protein n=1 Tax=Prevotella sp. OH937_COT-195 TaxID=2491051 RepID=UPI0013151A00|nr:hypothetical protein [Prevotella sp. OH937_COT-195]
MLRFSIVVTLPNCLVRLLTSAKLFHLDAARYALNETAAHLLNNRTKSVEVMTDLG